MDQAIDRTQRLENTLIAWKNLDRAKTFVFSVVSPDDDKVQQEKIVSAVLPVVAIAIRQQWRASGLPETNAFVGVLPSVHRERSPPLS